MDLDEALRTKCEHGISKIIICPKCNPQAYVMNPEQIARAKELMVEHERWMADRRAALPETKEHK